MPQGQNYPTKTNERIAKILKAISLPIWYDTAINSLRVFVAAGTVTTVTTVTAVTTVSQLGGFDAKLLHIDVGMRNLWASSIRTRIS